MDEKSLMIRCDVQRKVAYFGVPSDSVYRFDSETDPPYGVPLDPRTDFANLGSIGSDRRDIDADRVQLSIAILFDFMEDRARVARLYNAFSQRIRAITPADRCWMVTETEIAEIVAAVELDNQLTWDDKRGRYQDEPDQDIVAHKTIRKPKKEDAVSSAATR